MFSSGDVCAAFRTSNESKSKHFLGSSQAATCAPHSARKNESAWKKDPTFSSGDVCAAFRTGPEGNGWVSQSQFSSGDVCAAFRTQSIKEEDLNENSCSQAATCAPHSARQGRVLPVTLENVLKRRRVRRIPHSGVRNPLVL